jgi:uncharacterized RDD family membrane protein YckC
VTAPFAPTTPTTPTTPAATSTAPPTEPAREAYGGFWIRAWATFIDLLLVSIITLPFLWGIYGREYFDFAELILGPADFLITWVLPSIAVIVFWIYRSATPGKMAVGLRIVDARTGGRPSNGQLIGRFFAYFLSLLPLGLGYFWIAWDARKQGWHDKLAGTVVIRRIRAPAVPAADFR